MLWTFIKERRNIPKEEVYIKCNDISEHSWSLIRSVLGNEKADEIERELLIRRVSVETDLLSIEDGRLVYNEQKKKSFDFKHKIRKAYKDGIYLRDAYNKSEKFVQARQEDWNGFDGKLAMAVTFSYEQMLKEYLEHPSTEYEQEYPEFRDFRLYLSESEMNSLRWNKEKMMRTVKDKKKL